MSAPKRPIRLASGLLLLGILAVPLLGGCAKLLSAEEPPVILLLAELRRAEGRHELSVQLRVREGELPEMATVRFNLHAVVSLEIGEEERYGATLEGKELIMASGADAGILRLTFDSPFPFLPREPTQLSDLTLRALWRGGSQIWRGELLYPYLITESLDLN